MSSAFGSADLFNESLFQAYAGIRIDGTSDLTYRLYFNRGLVTEAEGYIYVLKSISNYEDVILLPQIARAVHDFPSVYSNSSASYISIVALKGSFTYFRLDTLIFQFLSQTVTPSGEVDVASSQFLFAYYIAFLFVTPTAMIILLGRAFKDEKDTTDQESTHHS